MSRYGLICMRVVLLGVCGVIAGDETPPRTNDESNTAGDAGTTGNKAATAQIQASEKYGKAIEVTNGIGMKLRLIPPGEFFMGSAMSPEETVRLFRTFEAHARFFAIEHPRHRVRITKPFYLGLTEVTQKEWAQVMGNRPWSGEENVREGPHYPAVYVSWRGAVKFCKKLSRQEGITYRLPTEAEWEYACRAGTSTMFYFGNDPARVSGYAWWGGMTGDGNCYGEEYAHNVMQKKPNGFGMYDMHGNAGEWCHDNYAHDHYYYVDSPTVDPLGPQQGDYRVFRGGAWSAPAIFQRSACRVWNSPNSEGPDLGFRVVADVDGRLASSGIGE